MTPKIRFIFLIILITAGFLRLFRITEVPPGVNRDEAAIGYTAYSLLKTGKDEYGRVLPLSFQSFGDWKLPLYIYTTVPFVATLGVNELSVRLPSALAGIASVALVFFLVEALFGSKNLGLLSMVILAISPWHLHLSRVESESNIAVMLITIGTIFFLKARQNPKLFIPGLISFALTYFAYHGNHIFTTLYATGLLAIYWKSLPKTKELKLAVLIFLIFVGIILSQTLVGADKTKISGISIFGNPNIIHEKIELPRNTHDNPQSFWTKLIHNRITYAGEMILHNYLQSYSADFLFIKGGSNHAHNINNFGNMYAIEGPFLLLGILALFNLKNKKEGKLLLWWLMIAPIAASITKDAPHTNRMFAVFPALAITVALGIHEWFAIIPKRKIFIQSSIILIFILYLANFSIYIDRYYIHFPKEESQNWGEGYKALTSILTSPKFSNTHVIMSDPESSPYIYLLFYSQFDPASYQKEAVRYSPTPDGFVHVKKFDRYEFKNLDWSADSQKNNTILIDFANRIPESLKNQSQAIDQFSVIVK